MKRRHFIKQTATIAPLILAFNPLSAARRSFLQSLLVDDKYKDRILVLIQLKGGNDALNTFIPIDKYSILSEARKNILIPENKILKLNDTSSLGFHPSLTGLQKLYNDKLVTVVQGVGSPNPSFSHTQALEIKYTADPERIERQAGWIGRYLEKSTNNPKGYPSQPTDGPAAIRLEEASSKITRGKTEDFGIGITTIADLENLSDTPIEGPLSNDRAGANIEIVRSTIRQLKLYAPNILSCSKKQDNLSKLYPVLETPNTHTLAEQLKIVARLIGNGLNTRIYVVIQSDYDVHSDQVDKSDTTKGDHARLLKDLSEAITAFQNDLFLMGKQDQVLGMTFSEFGRRIASNAGYGTDHGTADTMLFFGSKLKNGIIGSNPVLPSKVSGEDNLPVQFDFRTVYASVLKDWFGAPDETIKTIFNQTPGEMLSLIKS